MNALGDGKTRTRRWPVLRGHRPLRLSSLLVALLVLGASGLLAGCAQRQAPTAWPQASEPAATAEQRIEVPTRDLIARAQQGLTELGYKPGPIDGLMGPRTRAAIRSYQGKAGLAKSGRITAALVDRIEAEVRTPVQAETPVVTRHEAEIPRYEPGSTFVYSDGSVETVMGSEDDLVRWRRPDGTRFIARRNFLLGWRYWQSRQEQGTSSVKGRPATLWPRETGSGIEYLSKVQVQRRGALAGIDRWREIWRCEFEGTKSLTLVAGPFETLKFTCWNEAAEGRPTLTRSWFYAPAIGHYVRMIEVSSEEPLYRQVDLVAIQPAAEDWPSIARADLGQALVDLLESDETQAETPWTSAAVDARVRLQTTSDLRKLGGRSCRSYLQIWRDASGERRYPGVACRKSRGRWTIPGLEDDTAGYLAVSG